MLQIWKKLKINVKRKLKKLYKLKTYPPESDKSNIFKPFYKIDDPEI